jgi:hypothetical protein
LDLWAWLLIAAAGRGNALALKRALHRFRPEYRKWEVRATAEPENHGGK